MGTVDLHDAHVYHLRSRVLSSAGAMAAMIVLTVVMLKVEVPDSDDDKEND